MPKQQQSKTIEKTIYTCPMHPEVQSNKPGTCPKCGMELVKKTIKVAVQKPAQNKTQAKKPLIKSIGTVPKPTEEQSVKY